MTDSTSITGTAAVDDALPGTGSPQETAAPGAGLAAIETWTGPGPSTPGGVPLSLRTGEPTRLWTIWVAAAASYFATAIVGVATLLIFWNAAVTASLVHDAATNEWTYTYDDNKFAQASWLMGQFDTEPGSLGRVLLSVAVTAIALLIGTATAITGYYAYDGRRWTRWSALIALALSVMALMLTPVAWPAIGLAAIAVVALWLPPSARYFAAWRAVREHAPVFAEPPDQIRYGPLPKYRSLP